MATNNSNQPSSTTPTRESTIPLKHWLQTHHANPYPTKPEKIVLAMNSGMTLTQVSTWFANARRRLKKEGPNLYTFAAAAAMSAQTALLSSFWNHPPVPTPNLQNFNRFTLPTLPTTATTQQQPKIQPATTIQPITALPPPPPPIVPKITQNKVIENSSSSPTPSSNSSSKSSSPTTPIFTKTTVSPLIPVVVTSSGDEEIEVDVEIADDSSTGDDSSTNLGYYSNDILDSDNGKN